MFDATSGARRVPLLEGHGEAPNRERLRDRHLMPRVLIPSPSPSFDPIMNRPGGITTISGANGASWNTAPGGKCSGAGFSACFQL